METANETAAMMNTDNMENRNSISVFNRNRLGPKTNDRREDKAAKKSRYADYKCYSCGLYGHTSRHCRKNSSKSKKNSEGNFKRGRGKIHEIKEDTVKSESDSISDDSSNEAGEDAGLDFLNHMAGRGPTFIEVNVNDITMKMEVDTGACQTVISECDKKKYFSKEIVQHYKSSLTVVTGDPVTILGYIWVTLLNGTEKHNATIIIIKTKRRFMPLIGRTWLDILYPGWRTFFFGQYKKCLTDRQ